MRDWLTFDDIERLETSLRTAKAHRRSASILVDWAQVTNPDDEVTTADLLSAAAWHLGQAGDTDPSLELYRRAVTAEGTTTPDARSPLHAALLEAGRLDHVGLITLLNIRRQVRQELGFPPEELDELRP